jgi:DNA-binding winged helix-turn-helix (wHTH) protein/dipeptidyl aminopeptidase/acylaminoacyl peptidase
MTERQRRVYTFGAFQLDALTRELLRDGSPVKLYPKQFDVLLVLVERAGELVTKDELLRSVWPDATVEEGNLTTHISQLRKLLGDGGSHREYIVTLPGRGYRFIAPLRESFGAAAPDLKRRWVPSIAVGVAAVVSMIGLGIYIREDPTSVRYQQLTFRRGSIWSARFAPDGRTVVYGAAWEGLPSEVFLARKESPESQAVGLRNADVLSISSSGEMAVSLGRRVDRLWESNGTLAVVPLAGGAPREVAGGVKDADWAPDGERLAVVRRTGGRDRLEFPIDHLLYESDGYIIRPRVSRNADSVAFLERAAGKESVVIVNAAGEKKTLARSEGAGTGLAWSMSGEELAYTVVKGGSTMLHAVSSSARQRYVAQMPGEWKLHDIARDGRAILSQDHNRSRIVVRGSGDDGERDLSWLDRSVAVDLSRDGTTLLLTEVGAAAGDSKAVYLRKMDGSPAVRLGEGLGITLSQDGQWAAAIQGADPERLALLPTGVGQSKLLPRGSITDYFRVRWFPDGNRIVFGAIEPGRPVRAYAQDVAGGDPRPVQWNGSIQTTAFSPDGTSYVALSGGKVYQCNVEDCEPHLVPGSVAGDRPIVISDDRRTLFTVQSDGMRRTVHRIDLITGEREHWMTLTIPDLAGVMDVGPGFDAVLLAADGRAYAHNFLRMLSDLYLVEGLQ